MELAFARTLGLFDTTMIGVGAMIGAGIVVLHGVPASVSGPASILTFALHGGVTSVLVVKQSEGHVRSMLKAYVRVTEGFEGW